MVVLVGKNIVLSSLNFAAHFYPLVCNSRFYANFVVNLSSHNVEFKCRFSSKLLTIKVFTNKNTLNITTIC
jgi:hypothetical protein